jgi:hypothetical protein
MKDIKAIISDAIRHRQGFPLPDWKAIEATLGDPPGSAAPDLKDAAIRAWVELLSPQLGQRYFICEAGPLLCLIPFAQKQSQLLAESASAGFARILSELGEAARPPSNLVVVILFNDRASYQQYASCFIQGPTVAGVALDGDVQQILVHGETPDEVLSAVLHHMAHLCLSHLRIPRWLDEGLAQILGRDDVQVRRFRPQANGESRKKWLSKGLAGFWKGVAFPEGHAGAPPAYDLAEKLADKIRNDYREKWVRFLLHASPEDGGAAASVAVLGTRVEDLLQTVISGRDWPQREAAVPGEAVTVDWARYQPDAPRIQLPDRGRGSAGTGLRGRAGVVVALLLAGVILFLALRSVMPAG